MRSARPPEELAEEVIEEWFGPLAADGRASEAKRQRWWKKDPEFDAHLRHQYGDDVDDALAGGLTELEAQHPGSLALILLLDQFTRNIYRDTPQMYAGDERALALCCQLLDTGAVERYPWGHRAFIYMPLMHSEDLEQQERCVECFAELATLAPEPLRATFANNHQFAIAHRDIVARFGRFPHRNDVLGRESTPEEVEFLQQPGSSF